MTIIVFLIDTSASMYQRAYLGGKPTLLDVAKGAVETFVKVRQRSLESRGDRYMLLTFEDPPNNIKAGWKENLTTFMNELKNLQCFTMTTMGAALKHAFDVLNLNRMQTGIDTYGQGRCPFFLEPSVIVVITDGGKLSTTAGIQDEFNLPMHSPIPGSELTREPFRWDQRLFALVLRLAGTPAVERDTGLVPSDASPIDAMCEVTGGRSYCITSHRMMMQCIDSLVQKVQSGVVINFEKMGPDPPPVQERSETDVQGDELGQKDDGVANQIGPDQIRNTNIVVTAPHSTAWQNCRKLIYVPRSAKGFAVGFWPIPESFWPELSAATLPPRYAHPNVKFTCTSQEPMVIENLPFDKYELEPSPLTQFILARKQPTICWQVFVANSYKSSEVGHPFGYLKASTNLTCVNLFVMPYNYPVLLPLLEELFKIHRLKPTNEWRSQFQNYMRTMPAYYAGPLRRALTRMGIPLPLAQTLIPDTAENSLSYSVLNYLKRMKNQAKTEFDKLCNEVLKRQNSSMGKTCYQQTEALRVVTRSPLSVDHVSHPLLEEKFNFSREQLPDFSGFVVGVDNNPVTLPQSSKNPFDISRPALLEHVVRMRSNLVQSSLNRTNIRDEDSVHNMPVNQMGNYQEYLKRQTPQLREIESMPVRQHMFGNPFKIDKRMMVDEADIDLVGGSSVTASPNKTNKRNNSQADTVVSAKLPMKRKPGPIPREFMVKKPRGGSTRITTYPVSLYTTVEILNSSEDTPQSSSSTEMYDINYTLSLLYGDENVKMPRPSRSPSPTFPMENDTITAPSPEFNSRLPMPSTPSAQAVSVPVPNNTAVSAGGPIRTNVKRHSVKPNNVRMNDHVVEDSKTTIENIRKHNQNLKKLMFKDLKRPGRNFSALFDHLQLIQGGIDDQAALIQSLIAESLRFKRQYLANLLEIHLKDVLARTSVSVNNCQNNASAS